MFSFAYTVKDVIMNNCHGVNIALVHCQNIFACFFVSTLLSLESPTTIMRSEWKRNRNNLFLIVVRHFVLGKNNKMLVPKLFFLMMKYKAFVLICCPRDNISHKNVTHIIIINEYKNCLFLCKRFDVSFNVACFSYYGIQLLFSTF